MLIRPPRTSDIEAMARIELEARAAAERDWSPPPSGLRARSVAERAAVWRAALDGSTTRVAVVDTHVAGCVRWAALDGLPTLTGPFVDPIRWRMGVGRALVAVAMRRARLAGHDRLAAWVPEADPRARAFARRLGFVAPDRAAPGARRATGDGVDVCWVAILPAGLASGGVRG